MSIQTEHRHELALGLSASADPSTGMLKAGVGLIDPLQEPAAWDALVAQYPEATFFHTSAWARVLNDAYCHRPYYFRRSSALDRPELLPIMEVDSRWTGRRGVMLPFTDECPPLGTAAPAQQGELLRAVLKCGRDRGWKYLETRGGAWLQPGALPSVCFYSHQLPLARSESELISAFDSSVRRGIRKAQRAGLKVERRAGLESVRAFYQLHCQTRRRHGVPPQPFRFFEAVSRHVLDDGHGDVFVVSDGPRIVAAAVFFFHGRQVIYKFGASDPAAQAFRPNNLLMWEAIRWYAGRGFAAMHFGRTSEFAAGLRRFKMGFGAQEQRILYYRFDFARNRFVIQRDRAESWLSPVLRCLPASVLRSVGNLLYPHMS